MGQRSPARTLVAPQGPAEFGAKPLSSDTPLEVERIWLALQCEHGPLWRLRRAVTMTSFCLRAAREAVRRAYPDAGPQERDRLLFAKRYGTEVANELVRRRAEKGFYGR